MSKGSRREPAEIHEVGGREPDGTPAFIGPWTFQTRVVRDVVEQHLQGRVLNACAGKTHLSHDDEIIRNDLNPERGADYHFDVETIDEHFPPGSFDTVVFDPPFDQSQSDEHYGGMHARAAGPARKALGRLVRVGGVVVELGWNTFGLGMSDGWEREPPVHLFRRGPVWQPVFLVVDRKVQTQLTGASDV